MVKALGRVRTARISQVVAAALVAGSSLAACAGHEAGQLQSPAGAGAAPSTGSSARQALRPRPAATPTPTPSPSPTPSSKVQHIVIVIQENRSFDNLFQGYPGANTQSYGVGLPTGPGGATPAPGETPTAIPLQQIPLEAPYDIKHFLQPFLDSYDNGKMDGFYKEPTVFYTAPPKGYVLPPNPQYGYVPQQEVQTYWDMAKQYVLADNMFASQIDGSFTAHQYLIAGQAGDTVNLPGGLWGCDGGSGDLINTLTQQRTLGPYVPPCFTYPTLGSEIDAAGRGLSWRFYAPGVNTGSYGGIWSAFQAIQSVRNGPEWATNVISPETTFLQDVANGHLASLTWIVPNLPNSDHSSSYSKTGPQWVASLVDAVGNSQFWNTSVIFVLWDEWGGWYDHVPPLTLDYDGLGFRVPLLCISPYAKRGKLMHQQLEFGSILKFVEHEYGLPTLAASDKRAARPDKCFDFAKAPRPFQPFASTLPPSRFARGRPVTRLPDED
jgi:phospholipase C